MASERLRPRARTRRPADETFGAALGAAIRARGLSLTALRNQLAARGTPVSISTLSYWRSGGRQPEQDASMDAVRSLERILGLPDGDLFDRLGPSRRAGPILEETSLYDLIAVGADQRRESLDHELRDLHEVVDMHVQVVVDLGADGLVSRVTTRTLLRAIIDQAQRMRLVMRLDEPADHGMTFRVLSGGQLVHEALEVGDGDIYRSDILLERPLGVGETAMVEYDMTVPDATGLDYYEHYLLRRTNEVLIWVRFHPEAIPRRCEIYERVRGEHATWPVDLTGVTSAHHAVRAFGPGTVGIGWKF